jgi:hypothetical protein
MPMFSPWTIGSFSPGQNSFQCFETCCQLKETCCLLKKLAVSSIWTWLNILVTTTGMIIFPVVYYFLYIIQWLHIISCPLLLLSIMITGLLLHAGKRAQHGCCRGCKCCFPCRQKTVLDPNDIEMLIYVQDGELIYFEGEEARLYRSHGHGRPTTVQMGRMDQGMLLEMFYFPPPWPAPVQDHPGP